MLEDEVIKTIIQTNPENPAQALVEAANQSGGTDNISVIIIQ
jgi:serine/threonine protein phosphatase PrpC